MSLSSSYHDARGTAQRGVGSHSRSSGRPTLVRSPMSHAGRARASRRSTPRASSLGPALHRKASASPAAPSRLIGTTPTDPQVPSSQVDVTDTRDAIVSVGVLTSAALTQSVIQTEGRVTASQSLRPSRLRGNSLDGGSTAASTNLSRRIAQQRLLVEPATVTSAGDAPWRISGRCPSVQSSQSCATRQSSAKAMDCTGSLSPQPTVAATLLKSPGVSHLRPLQSSKKADYLNLAHQRSFMGRFRCATPVVVRTPAATTSHSNRAPSTADDSALLHLDSRGEEQREAAAAAACGTTDYATGEDGCASPSAIPDERRQGVEADAQHAVDESPPYAVAAGHPSLLAAAEGFSPHLGRRASAAGMSIASSGKMRRGAGRGRPSSVLNGAHPRALLLSSSASAVVLSTRTTVSASVKGGPFAANGEVPAANMEALAKSGLHTTLWLARQDGVLEVRSMANHNQVLASLPLRDMRVVITSLTEVCGNRVVAGYTDGSLRVYDAVTMKQTAEHHVHTAAVTCLLYVRSAPRLSLPTNIDTEPHDKRGSAPTQSLLLTGSLDRFIVVWEAASMCCLHKLKGSLRSICALAATTTGGYAFSGSDDGTLRMWDVVQGDQLTITKEERANLAKSGSGVNSSIPAPPPPSQQQQQQLAPASAAVPAAAAGQSRSSVSFRALHDVQAQSDRMASASTPTAHSSCVVQYSLLASVSESASNFAASGPSPLSISPAVASSRHHRSLEHYSAIKKSPLDNCAGARGGPVAIRGTHPLTLPADDSGCVSSLPLHSLSSSPLMPSAVVASVAPAGAGMLSSPFREGGMLVGPKGGTAPLHRGLEREAEARDEDNEGAMTDSGTAADCHHGDAARCPSAKRRTLRSLKRDIKKRAKGLHAKRRVTILSSISGRGPEGTKTKSASASPAAAKSMKRKKRAPKKVTKSTTLATESTPVLTRKLSNLLEQRLESWLNLYQQRVLLSATSMRLTQLISAGYDAVAAVNWPIECAHTECVTALTVVEDRLLVSASRDATAKVFALPSGQYVRTLSSSRRMPLSGVLYDASVRRLYTAFSDGGVAVYDTRCADLPLLSQLLSPHAMLASTFVLLRTEPMRRFVWAAAAQGEGACGTSPNGDSLSSVVVGAAYFDRTTMAHGPNQTSTSYRVGQPSLRELNAAVSLQQLQQQRALHLTKQAKQSANGALEEMELAGIRRCSFVAARAHIRRQACCVFVRWRQWAWRRALSSQFEGAVAARAKSCVVALLGRYAQRWLNWTRAQKKKSVSEVLREVQLRASEVVLLAVRSEVREGRRHVWSSMANIMERQQQIALLVCAYSRWREFLRAQQTHLRQSVAFNKLLLSMNASSYTPSSYTLTQMTRKAVRSANQAKALWILMKKTQSSQAHASLHRCFDLWCAWAQQHRRAAALAAESREWGAVEPLSAMLIQPRQLRRRYFALWHDFTLYVTRSERLSSERDTLGVEWAALQKAIEMPMKVGKMQEMLSAAESSTADAEAESKRLAARLETVSSEAVTLRTEAALNLLIAGYRIPSVVHATAQPRPPTGSVATEASSTASLHRGSVASSMSTLLSNSGCCGGAMVWSHSSSFADVDWTEEERAHRQEEDKLLFEVSAVLRALKGKAMQYDRDDKLLSTAHALALRLPIYEPAHRAQTSTEVNPGQHSRLSSQPQRMSRTLSAWSVSNVKSGGSTTVSRLSPSSQKRNRATSFAAGPTGSASPSSATVGLSMMSSTARNVTSAAQMWAAQPAEVTYACLADAFTAVYAKLSGLLHTAALECGVANVTSLSTPTRMASGTPGSATGDDSTIFVPTSWLTQVPLKQRRVMMGEVLKLVTLFDSFTAHNDLPVECAGSISTRGSTSFRSMPLCSLCSRDTAIALLEHASVLLELVDPHLWPRQIKLNNLQDAYAAAIAELNPTVSSVSFSGAAPHNTTVITPNNAGSGEPRSSLEPAPLMMQPLGLCLSDEALQDATTPSITQSFGPLSTERRTNRSASSVHNEPTQMTPLGSVLDGYVPARVYSADERLSSTLKSLEGEGATPRTEPQHLRHHSFSQRSYSGMSTPRSYTSRTATPLVAGTGSNTLLVKPYLGFRVNVDRDTQTMRCTTISIREVTPQYVNAEGADVDGPAQVAGLKVGDQLLRFAGYTVTDLAAFNAVVSRHVHTGAELPVVILRSGEQLCKTIVVGSRTAAGG
ncbi:hypothetical protein LPMP_190360 [Leishmania panamensis]|uniref:PDZ domain-containing protein n=1 Tax=Leishmania panamensis TaxID=5679 RepID=A0A088RN58_LEIPA|nr:hypothetical protein LPMP_190360 [Leishmania panamensis]AIN97378.1 hypothetical protein LPMP_190360 [Leishmania panamensis]